MPQIRDTVETATATLAAHGVAGLDAVLLISHVLGVTTAEARLRIARGDELSETAAAAFAALVQRRASREPLQHLTGIAHFRYLELVVGHGVFVPRPETEILVDRALDVLRDKGERPVVVDACSGSGAIALAIATEVPGSIVTAIEASDDAVTFARANIATLAPEVRLVHSPFLDVNVSTLGAVDLLVSNPPYVPSDAIPRDPEVRDHDPALALYSGEDGLDAIRDLAAWGRGFVIPGGAIALEHGEWQGESVRAALMARGWTDAKTSQDLTGRDRVTVAWSPHAPKSA